MKNLLPPVEKKKKWRNRKSKGWYKELIYLARKHKAWYENFFQSSRWCSFIFCSSLYTFLISDTSGGLDLNTVPRPSLTQKAKVLYDYDAADKNELSLLADEVSDMALA